MKKKYRTFLGTVATLLLCCAMLTCNIFAANPPEVIVTDNVIITLGGNKDYGVLPAIEKNTFVAQHFRTAYRSEMLQCDPTKGTTLKIFVENQGTDTIRFSYYINDHGTTMENVVRIVPGDYYPIEVTSSNGNGLSTSFQISVTPDMPNSSIYYYLSAIQY